MLDSPPVIVANVATLLLNVPLVVLKFADHEPALRHKVTKQSQ
jgi:hypothetical protein